MALRCASVAAAAAALALALVGCSGSAEPPPAPPPPGPLSSPAPAPLPPATDGDNFAACTDGDCEIRVGGPLSIPLEPRFGVSELKVESVGGNIVVFTANFAGGRVESNGCRSNFTGPSPGTPARARSECPAGGRLTLERISMGVAETTQDAAVIRLMAR